MKEAHGGIVSLVMFSSDGRSLISGSCDGGLKVWDVAGGELRAEHLYDVLVLDGRISSDSRDLTIVVGSEGAERPGIHQVKL